MIHKINEGEVLWEVRDHPVEGFLAQGREWIAARLAETGEGVPFCAIANAMDVAMISTTNIDRSEA